MTFIVSYQLNSGISGKSLFKSGKLFSPKAFELQEKIQKTLMENRTWQVKEIIPFDDNSVSVIFEEKERE